MSVRINLVDSECLVDFIYIVVRMCYRDDGTVLDGDASAVFKATFEPAPVEWTTAVSPAEATGDGAVTFPASGVTPAEGTVSAIAVDSEHYTFDHWERNGVSVGTNKELSAPADEPAEGETSVVYTAVFTAN